jgi:hypothetical protein
MSEVTRDAAIDALKRLGCQTESSKHLAIFTTENGTEHTHNSDYLLANTYIAQLEQRVKDLEDENNTLRIDKAMLKSGTVLSLAQGGDGV